MSLKKYSFADWILPVALLAVGGFHEYISCGLSVAMCIYLLVRLLQKKELRIRRDFLTSGVVALCLGYALTCLWGIDRGMAFVGLLKFLPVFLYTICLQQNGEAHKGLELLPWVAVVMAAVSAVGMQFPAGERLFAVAGRLAGFFQYPNTFAIFLLVCELLILKKSGKKPVDYILLVLLVAAFFYTGSRTAFVVAILANIGMLLVLTQKKARIISLAVLAGVFVAGLLLAMIPGSVFNRYLNISLTESTFVGRLLYWQDGLKLLVKYPFGMGYMGYYYDQLSVQTGVYSVMYLHNDLFQLVLDTGWIPAGIFLAALVSWFVKKDIPGADKIIVGALCLHSFFDFNLQFAGMFFLLIALVSPNTYDKHLVVKPKMLLKIALAVTAAVSLYMGSALMLAHQGERELADTLYPGNTQNKLAMLQQETDLERANTLAEEILKQNTRFYAPYSVRAKYSYSKGEFNAVIENARAALERNPFGHQGYEDYCRMLLKGMELYKKAGDATSAEICRQELLSVAEQLARNGDRLSALGKKINDQPVLELPRDLQTEIAKLGGKGR